MLPHCSISKAFRLCDLILFLFHSIRRKHKRLIIGSFVIYANAIKSSFSGSRFSYLIDSFKELRIFLVVSVQKFINRILFIYNNYLILLNARILGIVKDSNIGNIRVNVLYIKSSTFF